MRKLFFFLGLLLISLCRLLKAVGCFGFHLFLTLLFLLRSALSCHHRRTPQHSEDHRVSLLRRGPEHPHPHRRQQQLQRDVRLHARAEGGADASQQARRLRSAFVATAPPVSRGASFGRRRERLLRLLSCDGRLFFVPFAFLLLFFFVVLVLRRNSDKPCGRPRSVVKVNIESNQGLFRKIPRRPLRGLASSEPLV